MSEYLLALTLETGSHNGWYAVHRYGNCYFDPGVAVTVARGVQEIGADRVGIRLSPYGTFNDATDDNPHALYTHLCAQLRTRGIAYVHMIESRVNGATDLDASSPQVRNPSSHPFGPHS